MFFRNGFASLLATPPLLFASLNETHLMKPASWDRPRDALGMCNFTHLPNETHNDYSKWDPSCANDVDIIGQEINVVTSGLRKSTTSYVSAQVTSAYNRTLCLDNVKRVHRDGKVYDVRMEPTKVRIVDATHRFALLGSTSTRHANIAGMQRDDYYMSAAHIWSSYGEMCDWGQGQCTANLGEDALVWCHRKCSKDVDSGRVDTSAMQVLGKANDCVTLLDVNTTPLTTIEFEIEHGNRTQRKAIETGLASGDDEIHRVQSNVRLDSSSLILYQDAVYDGSDKRYNSKDSTNMDMAFAYGCTTSTDQNYGHQETWVPAGSWGPTFHTLGSAQQPHPSSTKDLPSVSSDFSAIALHDHQLVAHGLGNTLVTYYFKTPGKITNIYEIIGAVSDFDCYYQGETQGQLLGISCKIRSVSMPGTAVMRVYGNNTCTPLHTVHVLAKVDNTFTVPIIFFGQQVHMTICSETGVCKEYIYSTKDKHIQPQPHHDQQDTNDQSHPKSSFWDTLTHLWNFGAWGKFLTCIGSLIGLIAVAVGLFYLTRLLKIMQLFCCCGLNLQRKRQHRVKDTVVEL